MRLAPDPPPACARLPEAAGTLDDVGQLARAADGHHAAIKLGELDRADVVGQRRERRGTVGK
jgi:hypothetical protein